MNQDGALHAGIYGPTLCGKTTLGKELCADFEARGYHTLVCHPWDRNWPCTWWTNNLEQFIAKAKDSRSCALFIDEGGQVQLRDAECEWLVTGARNWGHVTHLMGNATRQITPTMRDNLSRLFLFKCGKEAAKKWYEVFAEEDIKQAVTLEKYQFLQIESFQPTLTRKLNLKGKSAHERKPVISS